MAVPDYTGCVVGRLRWYLGGGDFFFVTFLLAGLYLLCVAVVACRPLLWLAIAIQYRCVCVVHFLRVVGDMNSYVHHFCLIVHSTYAFDGVAKSQEG